MKLLPCTPRAALAAIAYPAIFVTGAALIIWYEVNFAPPGTFGSAVFLVLLVPGIVTYLFTLPWVLRRSPAFTAGEMLIYSLSSGLLSPVLIVLTVKALGPLDFIPGRFADYLMFFFVPFVPPATAVYFAHRFVLTLRHRRLVLPAAPSMEPATQPSV
jgi:hypothetical protein